MPSIDAFDGATDAQRTAITWLRETGRLVPGQLMTSTSAESWLMELGISRPVPSGEHCMLVFEEIGQELLRRQSREPHDHASH